MISSSEIEKFLGEHTKIFNAIREHGIVFFIRSDDSNRIIVDNSARYDRGRVYYDIMDNDFNFTSCGEISATTEYLFFYVKEAFAKYLELIEENDYMPDGIDRHFYYDGRTLWKTCRQKFLDFIRQKIEQMPDGSGSSGQEVMEKMLREIFYFSVSLKNQNVKNDQSN